MHKVMQTVFSGTEGNCFSACVASIMEIGLEEVPFFMGRKDWFVGFNEWLRPLGFYSIDFLAPEDPGGMAQFGVHIRGGLSPRGDWHHAVVGCGTKIVHDPHPDGTGIKTFEDFQLIVRGVM